MDGRQTVSYRIMARTLKSDRPPKTGFWEIRSEEASIVREMLAGKKERLAETAPQG
jgi:hypothetical protein